MKPRIAFSKIWFDDDMVEFRIGVSDGQSLFMNEAYIGHEHLKDVIRALTVFKDQVYGGIYDLRFGEFGPEYASGAFHARFHFQERGIIHISVEMQSDYREFGKKIVASKAKLYVRTEPALLDTFIEELSGVCKGNVNEAHLTCV
jgi:hypothetical protein